MPLDQFMPYLPAIAIAAGVALILWGQRHRLKGLVGGGKPAAKAEEPMSPTDRFETFYALRSWCEKAGHVAAVKMLDSEVLPTIVRNSTIRFDTLYALRSWCEKAGHTAAVKVLDSQVLPAIIRNGTVSEGESKS